MRRTTWRGLALVLTLGCFPATAGAAEPVYVQYACHLPSGAVAPADGFVPNSTGSAVTENRCAGGGGITTVLPDGESSPTASGQWQYSAPPGTHLAHVAMTRTAHNIFADGTSANRWFAIQFSEDSSVDGCGWFGSCPVERIITADAATDALVLKAHCGSTACHGPEPGEGIVSIDEIIVTLRDDAAPAFTEAPAGDLLSEEPVGGIRSVTLSATDVGGGVFKAALVVDGQERSARILDPNDGSCAKPFVRAIPCKQTATGTLTFDTRVLADGEHTISVVVYDATEVNSVTSGAVTIRVRNSTSSVTASGAPLQGGSDAIGGLNGVRMVGRAFRKGRVVQPFGRSRTIRGRLLMRDGTPLAETPLVIFSAVDVPGARERRIAETRTDDEGRFSFTVSRGPSRRIMVRSSAGRWPVKITVPAPLKLLPSREHLRNKQKLWLTAYLAGSKAPRRSADVAFQVLIGDHWRTFATRPIGSDGRAQVGHRFRVTYQRMTYRFRAIVVRRRNFPFANATSRAVAVRVN